jgi:Spy/CpxP family protein refolding chaperone
VLALVALLAGSAFAQGRQQGRQRVTGFPPGLAEARLIKETSKEIGVGEETLKKLEKLVAEIRAEEEKFQAKTREARSKVQALLDQSRPDEPELLAAVGAVSAATLKAREHGAKASLRIRALLTKEQLGKFMEMRKKAMERRRRGGRARGS